ncbi:MAG: hypothetical protein R2804_08495 [Cyclobacteriaceae bacterium]
METISLTKKQLHELVWSTPLSKLAKHYGMSDVGLRKLCIRHNIPIPKNGHWQKIRFGKMSPVIELPLSQGNDTITIQMEDDPEIKPINYYVNKLQKEIEDQLAPELQIPKRLIKPHELITATYERFQANSKRDYNSKIYKIYPKELDLVVSANKLNRALVIFNTIIKLFLKRGHELIVENRETRVIIFGQAIGLRIREKNRIIKEDNGHWPSQRYEPTGILYLSAKVNWSDKTWTDGKQPLEMQLSRIMAYLEIKAEELKIENDKREIERIERERIKLQRKQFEALQDEELKKFKLLLGDVDKWRKVKLLRKYINEFEAVNKDESSRDNELGDYIEWVRKKIDWYDPRINAKDELFHDLDKETLKFNSRSNSYGY